MLKFRVDIFEIYPINIAKRLDILVLSQNTPNLLAFKRSHMRSPRRLGDY